MTVNVTDLDEIAPLITGATRDADFSLLEFSLEEEYINVHTFTADEEVTWSIDGGSDQDKFTIDETTGALSFVDAPDYETPTDSDTNNTYTVSVKATDDSANSSSQTLTVTITDDEDQNPGIVFTPAGDYVIEDNENSNIFYFEENNLVFGTASSDEEYKWEIIGTDSDLFTISSEGVVSFISAPDYENPTDSDQDNTYVVELKATDVEENEFLSGEGSVIVTDVNEVIELEPIPEPEPEPEPTPEPIEE